MRIDYASYIITILCFTLGAFLFMGYAQYIEVTTGDQMIDLVTIGFSLILGLAFAGLGYVARPKKQKPAPLPSPIPYTPLKPHLKRRLSLPNIVSLTLLATGIVGLTASVLFSSSTLALVGLGLIFYGALFLYIRTGEYIEETLFDKTIFPSLANLNQMVAELGFKGQAVYLPPEYLKDFESSKVFIAKQRRQELPTPEQIPKEEDRMFLTNPEGVLLTPPGAALTRFFEKTLDTSFTKVDLRYLERRMPKLLVEDLEIAENVEIEDKKSKVYVKIENSIYKNMHLEAEKLPNVRGSIGCPICSAIACAIAKAAGKPVTIERDQTSEDGRIIAIEYRLL